jgi:hypothetical protein
MKASETITKIPPELVADFAQAADDLAKGIRHPEKMAEACQHMDLVREKNRKLFGERKIAVKLVRETRDEA